MIRNDPSSFEKTTSIVERHLDQGMFSGVSLHVLVGEKERNQIWGNAVQEEQEKEILTTSHLFDLASLTKIFTTTAILRLIDMHAFFESTKVLDLLPFSDAHVVSGLSKVDVVALMTHTSSLRPWYPFYTKQDQDFEAILSHILYHYPPQIGVAYSDLNYMLLGKIIEQVVQKPLDEAMQELVFTPLSLNHTTYHPKLSECVATEFGNQIEKKMVTELGLEFAHWRKEHPAIRGACNDGNGFYYFNGVSGHAGIFSDAKDVAALGKVFCNDAQSFIHPDLLTRALQNTNNRGYGFQFGTLYPEGGFGHTGFTGTYLYINPIRNVVVSLLTNRLHAEHVQNINAFRQEVITSLLMEKNL